jgi:hypothetical protein
MLPERFTLVSAALDALPMYWDKLYRPDSAERMSVYDRNVVSCPQRSR